MTQILVKKRKHIGKEVHQGHQERATSYSKGRFKLQNKSQ